MTKDQLIVDPGLLPVAALVVFLVVASVVVLYILTDRRAAHHRRMVRLALDEDRTHG